MNDPKLQSFIDLVTFDQNLIKLEKSIDSSDNKINQLRRELEQIQQIIGAKKNEHRDLKKRLDLQELAVKDLQDKEKQQSEVVQNISNTKELEAAHKQLEHLKIERDRQEQQLMKLWNLHEALEKEVDSFSQQHESKSEEIKDEILKEQESVKMLQKKLDDLQQQRNTKVAVVPDDWLRRYEHMRGKASDPVVPVLQDSCSACFYSISSRDLQTLKQGDLLQCKDCYRFLYFEKEEE